MTSKLTPDKAARLQKKKGVWVFSGERAVTNADVEKVRREVRSERKSQLTGRTRRSK